MLVVLAVLLSYFFFKELQGIREGTIISAICVGIFVKGWLSLFRLVTGKKTDDQ